MRIGSPFRGYAFVAVCEAAEADQEYWPRGLDRRGRWDAQRERDRVRYSSARGADLRLRRLFGIAADRPDHPLRKKRISWRSLALRPLAVRHRRAIGGHCCHRRAIYRSEEHTPALQSLIRIPYAVFCLPT